MLFLSRLSFPRTIYLSALPRRLLSLDAINLFPTTRPCSLSRELVAHEGPHPLPAAAGNHFGVVLWLVFSQLYLCCTGEQEPSCSKSICGLLLMGQAQPSAAQPLAR